MTDPRPPRRGLLDPHGARGAKSRSVTRTTTSAGAASASSSVIDRPTGSRTGRGGPIGPGGNGTDGTDGTGTAGSDAPEGEVREVRLLSRTRGSLATAELLLWLAGVPAVLFFRANLGEGLALTIVSVAALAFGLSVFLRHGGRMITATGVYFFASAVFVGYSGLILNGSTGVSQRALFDAAIIAHTVNLAVYLLFLRTNDDEFRRIGTWTAADRPPGVMRWAVRRGWVLFILGVVLAVTGAPLGPIAAAAAYSGVLLIGFGSVVGMTSRGIDRLSQPVRWGLVLVAFAGYYLFVFTGGGRLNLATLAVALLVSVLPSMRTQILKPVLVVAVIPMLLVFAWVRHPELGIGNTDALTQGAGLVSVTAPLETFATLLELDEAGLGPERANGHTFVVATVVQVPRSVWPNKPPGFGTVLTERLLPHLLVNGHSMAALLHGEFYFNFGMFGIVLMVGVTGVVLRFFDHRLAVGIDRGASDPKRVLRFLIWVVLGTSVADLLWVGTFSYNERGGTRALVLLVLYGVMVVTEDRSWVPRQRLKR